MQVAIAEKPAICDSRYEWAEINSTIFSSVKNSGSIVAQANFSIKIFRGRIMKKEICFIYTDAFLDDICATEMLAANYKKAIVFVTLENEIKGSAYCSDIVTNGREFLALMNELFEGGATDYTVDDSLPADCDIYSLAPLTDFAEIIRKNPDIKDNYCVMMAGINPGVGGALNEWNASRDASAYDFTVTQMNNLRQVTRNECLEMYAKNGYPFECRFMDEYIVKMNKIGENLTCFDLQAVSAGILSIIGR